MTLYHGTTEKSANLLLEKGWQPNSWPQGNHCGNPSMLHCTTDPQDALWFSQEKGESVVLVINNVSVKEVIVDPHDGGEGVQEELKMSKKTGMPAKLSIVKSINTSRIHRLY